MTTNAVCHGCHASHASPSTSPSLPPSTCFTHMSRVTRWTRVTLVALAAPAGLPLLVSLTGLAWPGLVWSALLWSWAGHGLAWARCRLARSSLLNTLLHLSQPYFMLCHFRCIFFALFCRLHRRLPTAFPFVCSLPRTALPLSCCAVFLCSQ